MAQSNEPTIEQMNEVIARFMGIEPVPSGTLPIGHMKRNEESIAFLNYHEEWGLLMPVVEKIAKTVSMLEVPKNDYELDAFEIIRRPIYTAISTIHNDVYQFITWYNQQKQTNEQ